MSPCRLLIKGKVTRSIEVYYETYDIAYGIGCIYLYEQLAEVIYTVMYGSGKTTIN